MFHCKELLPTNLRSIHNSCILVLHTCLHAHAVCVKANTSHTGTWAVASGICQYATALVVAHAYSMLFECTPIKLFFFERKYINSLDDLTQFKTGC
jgi:hypothetical protein